MRKLPDPSWVVVGLTLAIGLSACADAALNGQADATAAADAASPDGKAPMQMPDAWITTKVKSAILAQTVNRGVHVHVRTEQGAVVLAGTVDSQALLDKFVQAASRVHGVKSVDASALAVQPR